MADAGYIAAARERDEAEQAEITQVTDALVQDLRYELGDRAARIRYLEDEVLRLRDEVDAARRRNTLHAAGPGPQNQAGAPTGAPQAFYTLQVTSQPAERWWTRCMVTQNPRLVPGVGGSFGTGPSEWDVRTADPADRVGFGEESISLPNPQYFANVPMSRLAAHNGPIASERDIKTPRTWDEIVLLIAKAQTPQADYVGNEDIALKAWDRVRHDAHAFLRGTEAAMNMDTETARRVMAFEWRRPPWEHSLRERRRWYTQLCKSFNRSRDDNDIEDKEVAREHNEFGRLRPWSEARMLENFPPPISCDDPPPFHIDYFDDWVKYLLQHPQLELDGVRRNLQVPQRELMQPDELRGLLYIAGLGPPPHIGARMLHWIAVFVLAYKKHGQLEMTAFSDLSIQYPWRREVRVHDVVTFIEELVEEHSQHPDAGDTTSLHCAAREPISAWLRNFGASADPVRKYYMPTA
ncbi:hypothetical protein PHLGIDRAFT_123357 [Phlebiopsis gigantea 11061_1 CR5-6]|uniref:Uncharacterized protein n=1 Tax=Phlebiopsis gigantea (strain 11061_1 CR5-6) TaxID=745531 RepID=A0A0C3RPI9_PHLG1|nr:hypothetical protein PHLGIDRAFT_123357 [Phlebiopsis gigantea 11061_1 CR5-6]